ncbi:MAG: hypothetical protein IRY83_15600 [Chloroflexi bacterium]|nr:hypothetical protein [Chloroflexota bacterium]
MITVLAASAIKNVLVPAAAVRDMNVAELVERQFARMSVETIKSENAQKEEITGDTILWIVVLARLSSLSGNGWTVEPLQLV